MWAAKRVYDRGSWPSLGARSGGGVTSEHGLLHVVVVGMGKAGRAPIHLKLLYGARICWLVALHLGAAEAVKFCLFFLFLQSLPGEGLALLLC